MPMSPRGREWLLKVALVELGLWIARSDGEVTRQEAAAILQLLKDWGANTTELLRLKDLGARRVVDSEPPTDLLAKLPRLLSREQRPVFLETLAEAAFVGQPRCSIKVGRLLDVCRALRMDQLEGLTLINAAAARASGRRVPEPDRRTEPTAIIDVPPELRRALGILGLQQLDATAARRAYQKLTLRYHPDRNPSADTTMRQNMISRLLQVRTAYEQVLAAAS